MGRKTSFVQAIMVADSAIIDSIDSEQSLEDELTSKQSTASEPQIMKSEYEKFDEFDFDMDELDFDIKMPKKPEQIVEKLKG